MRRPMVIGLCVMMFLTTLPASADAWWYWLDEYSGPGPFTGLAVQYRLACINDPKPEMFVISKRRAAAQVAQLTLQQAQLSLATWSPSSTSTKEEIISDIEKKLATAVDRLAIANDTTSTAFTSEVQAQRNEIDPGDGVLRSLASFKASRSHRFWATVGGVGCVFQPNDNPIASLSIRLGGYRSLYNHLTYSEPEYANSHGRDPAVWLVQPELAFTAFVDSRKAVEVGSAAGISFSLVDKPGVHAARWFYWRPIILSVAPAPLLRATSYNWLRAITLTSSIVITPKELTAETFGAIPGTFKVSRDIQGMFGIVFDLSRFGTQPRKAKS